MNGNTTQSTEPVASPPQGITAWGEPSEALCATVRPNLAAIQFDVSDSARRLSKRTVGYVLTGADRYREQYASEEIPIPDTFGEMETFDGYIGMVTAAGSGDGWGITRGLLESAVRLVSGNGRYDAEEITLYGCRGKPALISGPRGVFTVGPVTLSCERPEAIHDYHTHEVAGVSVLESDSVKRAGIERLTDVLEAETDTELASHERISGGRHIFRTEDDRQVTVAGRTLEILATMSQSPEEITSVGEDMYSSLPTVLRQRAL